MGLWNLSRTPFHRTLSSREGKDIIKEGYRRGIRYFDAAYSYGDAESLLRFVRARAPRVDQSTARGARVPRRVHGGGLEASVDDADDQSVTHFFTSPLTASSPASNASAAGPLTLLTGTVNAMPVFFSSKRNFSFIKS